MSETTFFWHDYETFGTNPQTDKPSQFAGIRTDRQFNIIEEPVTFYCRPSDDCLPHPEACIITGITPQTAAAKGFCEAEFTRLIHQQLSHPGTCGVGYNSIRFDDEVTRNLLYRNFYDPYAREWQNQNSRWDLIDVLRAAHALRPQGIEWPINEEGNVSFRLELLTQANEIEHFAAHDALSDVYATIAIAKLLQQKQPRLYSFLFEHRSKAKAQDLLKPGSFEALVHVSGMYSTTNNCLAVVLPLCEHPRNSNEVIVYDLSQEPQALLDLDAEQIKQRLFTVTENLPEGAERIALKTVHINKCPVLAPLKVIRPDDAERLQIDLARCQKHLTQIKAAPDLTRKLQTVFHREFANDLSDPDKMIYSGGFFKPHDKALMNKIRQTPPSRLGELMLDFEDKRLDEMFFRYRARNFPEALDEFEQQLWKEYCQEVMTLKDVGPELTLEEFISRIQAMEQENNPNTIVLNELKRFAEEKEGQLV